MHRRAEQLTMTLFLRLRSIMINGHRPMRTSVSAFSPHRREPPSRGQKANLIGTVSANAALAWRGLTACWHATSVIVLLAKQVSGHHSWLAGAETVPGGPGKRRFTWLGKGGRGGDFWGLG